MADKLTTAVLGHNQSATNRPLTAHYVGGGLNDDMWAKRVDENLVDTVLDVASTESGYRRKFLAFKTEEVTEACLAAGLGTELHRDRAR